MDPPEVLAASQFQTTNRTFRRCSSGGRKLGVVVLVFIYVQVSLFWTLDTSQLADTVVKQAVVTTDARIFYNPLPLPLSNLTAISTGACCGIGHRMMQLVTTDLSM